MSRQAIAQPLPQVPAPALRVVHPPEDAYPAVRVPVDQGKLRTYIVNRLADQLIRQFGGDPDA